MSVYTTTFEIISFDDELSLNERIEKLRGVLFDFDYYLPLNQYYTEDFKKYFETCFINKYFFNEIGSETITRFKQRLQSKILEITPQYSLMFEALNKIDFDTLLDTREIKGNRNNEINENSSNNKEAENKHQGKTGNKTASSNLPENMLNSGTIGDFTNVGYANNATITRGDDESLNTNFANETVTKTIKENNEYKETERSTSQFDLLKLMNNDFNTFFEKFLNEFKILFMSIYY